MYLLAGWISCEWYTWMSGTTVIFFFYGGNECIRKQPTYIRSPSYFATLLQTLYFYYSKTHALGLLQHFDLERPLNCKIDQWLSRWRPHEHHCFIRHFQRSSTRNDLFVWVTPGLKIIICDVISAQCNWCYNHGIKKLPNHWSTPWYYFRDNRLP